jgi:uncharacterized protein (DUF302 family)
MRKYRLAIEAIAGCYYPSGISAALHNAPLSNLKPFGILVGCDAAPCFAAMRRRVISSPEEQAMFARIIQICSAFLLACVLTASSPPVTLADNDGVVRVRSAYPLSETIERLKKDIADKGIKFFTEIDQSKLAAEAGIKLQPSILLIFGNPPLGTLFITANANAGLDWPVRLLVFENEKGEVWTAYTDFDWIARRHGIENRKDQFKMASTVIASITSSVKAK